MTLKEFEILKELERLLTFSKNRLDLIKCNNEFIKNAHSIFNYSFAENEEELLNKEIQKEEDKCKEIEKDFKKLLRSYKKTQ